MGNIMLNLYAWHNQKEKLEKYWDYAKLIDLLIEKEDGEYSAIKHIIVKSPEYSYWYALYIIKERWPQAEPYIMGDTFFAYCYANDVLDARWAEAEPYIMKNPWHANYYAKDVIGDRWIEAEPVIMKNGFAWNEYCNRYQI
jgi:hypothetical protein